MASPSKTTRSTSHVRRASPDSVGPGSRRRSTGGLYRVQAGPLDAVAGRAGPRSRGGVAPVRPWTDEALGDGRSTGSGAAACASVAAVEWALNGRDRAHLLGRVEVLGRDIDHASPGRGWAVAVRRSCRGSWDREVHGACGSGRTLSSLGWRVVTCGGQGGSTPPYAVIAAALRRCLQEQPTRRSSPTYSTGPLRGCPRPAWGPASAFCTVALVRRSRTPPPCPRCSSWTMCTQLMPRPNAPVAGSR